MMIIYREVINVRVGDVLVVADRTDMQVTEIVQTLNAENWELHGVDLIGRSVALRGLNTADFVPLHKNWTS